MKNNQQNTVEHGMSEHTYINIITQNPTENGIIKNTQWNYSNIPGCDKITQDE